MILDFHEYERRLAEHYKNVLYVQADHKIVTLVITSLCKYQISYVYNFLAEHIIINPIQKVKCKKTLNTNTMFYLQKESKIFVLT